MCAAPNIPICHGSAPSVLTASKANRLVRTQPGEQRVDRQPGRVADGEFQRLMFLGSQRLDPFGPKGGCGSSVSEIDRLTDTSIGPYLS
jgi:hypothetical protein